MIPYISWHTIAIGPLTVQVWGLFVAAGFALGTFVAAREARKRGLKPGIVLDIAPLLLFAAMIGGRLFHVFVYDPSYYLANPLEIPMIWKGGASIFGGFLGALVAALWYMRKKQVDVWKYADVLIFGLPFGKAIGRLGCFFIHDHPGTATDFVLGVKYPDGEVRHDHGLYLAINGALMSIVFMFLSRKPRKDGFYIGLFCAWYGVVRFILDFYRVADVKYLGLTPAQYLCIAMTIFGIAVLVWITKRQKKPVSVNSETSVAPELPESASKVS